MKNSKGRDAASEELRKRQKLIRRREKRRLHLPQREKHNYVLPLQLKASKVEDHDPIQPFTLAPCQLCVIGNCSGQGTGHESPIIVAISSRGKSPAACGIFCNINSPYNKTFMLHGETLNRREIEIHSVIAALKQVHVPHSKTSPAKHLADHHQDPLEISHEDICWPQIRPPLQ